MDAARRLAAVVAGDESDDDASDVPSPSPAIVVGVWVRPRAAPAWRGAAWAAAIRFCAAAATPDLRRVAQGDAFLLALPAAAEPGWRLLAVSRRDGKSPRDPLPLASWRGAADGRPTADGSLTLTLAPGPPVGRLAGGAVEAGGGWRREWGAGRGDACTPRAEEPPPPPPSPLVEEGELVVAVDDDGDDIDEASMAALEAKYGLSG